MHSSARGRRSRSCYVTRVIRVLLPAAILFGLVFPVVALAQATTSPVITNNNARFTGAHGQSINVVITATNNPTSYAASGLPPGLTLEASRGTISGYTSAPGSFTSTVSASNAAGTGTGTLRFDIGPPAANGEFAPRFTIEPRDITNIAGGDGPFQVSTNYNPGPVSVQWYRGSQPIAGATNEIYYITGLQVTDSGTYFAIASNPMGSTKSRTATLAVQELRLISKPTDQAVPPGGSATFTINVSSTETPTYRWTFGGQTIAGATTASLTVSNVTEAQEGYYTCWVTTSFSSLGESGYLTFARAPTIIAPMQPTSGVVGQRVFVTARIAGTEPLAYQWFKNGVALTGATNQLIEFPSVQRSDAGDYTVRVTNSMGTATSAPGTLTVFALSITGATTKIYDGTPLAASATTDPAGLAVAMSYSRGSGFLMTGPPVDTGTYYAHATVHDGPYHGVVTAELKILPATIAVSVRGLHQVYDGQPKIVRVATASNAVVWPEYSGAGVPLEAGAYPVQLLTDDGNIRPSLPQKLMMVIEKAPQAVVFDPLPATLAVATPFSLRATSTAGLPVAVALVSGNATLNNGQLTLNDTNPVVVRATQAGGRNHHPASETLTVAASKQNQTIAFATLADRLLTRTPITLSATASSGLAVGFEVVGGPATISGSTLSFTGYEGIVTLRAVQSGNAAYNAAASVVRSFAVLTAERPVITAHPVSRTVLTGQDVTFSIGATGSGPLTYVWIKDGVPMKFSRPIEGSYGFRNADQARAGQYSVAVFNGSSCVVTNPATLTVELAPNPDAVPPVIASITPNQSLRVGDSLTILAGGSAGGGVFYQWYKDGVAIPGAINGEYHGNTAIGSQGRMLAGDVGTYYLVARNSAGSGTSPSTTVSLAPGFDNLRPPLITGYSVSTWTLIGGTASLTVDVIGEGVSYRWIRSGQIVPGATGATLTISNAQLSDAGTYAVSVENAAGMVNSVYEIFFAVHTGAERGEPFSEMSEGTSGGSGGATGIAPTIITLPVGGTFEYGSRAVLSVTAEGTAPLTYEWRREGVPLFGGTQPTYVFASIQPGDAGFYSVVVRNNFGSIEGGTRVQVSAEPPSNPPRPPAITTAPVAQTVTEGGTAIFSVNVSGSQPLSFQWRKNRVPLGDAHAQTLTIANVQLSDAGDYEVSAVNPYGGVTSPPVALRVNPRAPTTPPPSGTWQEQTIGGALPAGTATVTGDVVNVRGGGADIWGVSDAFHFRYQALSGDGEIIARVTGLEDTHGWAKGGVMIRESLAPGARNAMALVTPGFVAAMQSRSANNADTVLNNTQWVSNPRWLRLVRVGSTVTAYHSEDGAAWTLMASVQLALPTTIYAGLAVTSHLNGTLTTATFDHVSFAGTAATPEPPPPTPIVLPAPSGLTATVMSATAVNLAWVDNSTNETGFEVQRSTDNATFTTAFTVGANVTSIANTGLSPATTYYFRVRAIQTSATSAYSATVSATTQAATTPPPPPSGAWQTSDIGGVAVAGSASESAGVVTLAGSGADIWDTGDEFRYRYQSWTGDGEIVARLTGLTDTNAWAKAGVMFRENLTASARHVLMCLTVGNGAALQRRTTTGGPSDSTGAASGPLPRWVRLTRAGSTFTGYQSVDGSNWTQVGTITLPLPATIYLGLAVTSHNDGTLCTATFDNVSVPSVSTPPPPPATPLSPPSGLSATATSSSAIALTWTDNSTSETGFEIERGTDGVNFTAAGATGANVTSAMNTALTASTTYYFRVRAMQGATPSAYSAIVTATTFTPSTPPPSTATWQASDIGNVAAAGSTSDSGGVVTLTGSGDDIWNNADEFRYRYQSLTGDGEIIARLTGLANVHPWAKAGVMFRESTTAGARHAFMCLSAGNGAALQRRTTAGGISESSAGTSGSTLPRWLRLVRIGNVFTGYESTGGTTWTPVGSVTIELSATIFVGLAVTSHSDGVLCTATFDNVSVTAGTPPGSTGPTPPPPSTLINAPSQLAATAVSATQIDLTWVDNSNNETDFQVERSTDNVAFTLIPPNRTPRDSTRYSDTGLTAGTTYYYRVRALGENNARSGYTNVASAVTPAAPPIPSTWSNSDVGAVGIAGAMTTGTNTITLRGSGADIWENSDSFRFVYRTLSGDCTVETQVTSLTNTHGWAKAGVMIRESLAPGARNVFAFLTPSNGVGVQLRSTASSPTGFVPGPWGTAIPYWVRLVRTGTQITAYSSANGTSWTQIASYSFGTGPMLVGFAVTSHDNSQLATAVFTDPFIE